MQSKHFGGIYTANPVRNVIDLDLSNYFGTIDHDLLMVQLSNKIQDKRFLRYIRRMFKAGVLSNGDLTVTDEGVPQGSICSPILANIYAHYALDDWFNRIVKNHCKGRVEIFRYADDGAPRRRGKEAGMVA
jgi:retron-type reverse transcriptase